MPIANMRSCIWALCLPSLLAFVSSLEGQPTAPKRGGKDDACPDTRGWKGRYANYSYGFSIEIPKHLQGFWNSAQCSNGPDGCVCMSDHGRIIPLTPEPYEPERHIEVFAGYAAGLDEPTIALEVANRLGHIRQRGKGKDVSILRRSKTLLAGIEAERVVVRYYDDESSIWRIEDFIEALQGGVEYSLYIRTGEKSYAQDRPIFEAGVRSFTLTRK